MEIGTDIIEIDRIDRTIQRFPRFKYRIFTEGEIAYCEKGKHCAQHYAARFAAKESVMKALEIEGKHGISFRDIEIVIDPTGKPGIRLHGQARLLGERLGVTELKISLSHCRSYAVATALLVKRQKIDIQG
jgi:holo-[acyl-carrier protein] synthase